MGLPTDFEASCEADSLNCKADNSLNCNLSQNLVQQFEGERANITSIQTRQEGLTEPGNPKQKSSLPKDHVTSDADKMDASPTVRTSSNNHPSFPNQLGIDMTIPHGDNSCNGNASVAQSVDGWVLQREVAFMRDHRSAELQGSSVLAVSNSGEFIFVERGRVAAHVFDPYGVYRFTLQAEDTLRQTRTCVDTISGFIRDAAFSKANHIIICDCSRFVKIFSKNGQYLCAFITTEVTDNYRGQVRLSCLAVSRGNRVFVGDWNRRCVTVHEPNGGRVRLIECTRPARLAVSGEFLIVLPADPMDSIKLLDHQGNTKRALRVPATLSPWQPVGIACSSHSRTVIVVNRQDGGKKTLHQFALSGDYEGCVTRNLVEPSCLAMTQNGKELVVTDVASMKIFQKL